MCSSNIKIISTSFSKYIILSLLCNGGKMLHFIERIKCTGGVVIGRTLTQSVYVYEGRSS